MQVICYDCYGTGEIGVTKDNRVIACETCGGHEDELGTGYLEARCMACLDKDAEIARLRAELNAALDALRAAPKPPWHFRPTIGWQGVYCDWYEAQVALGQTEV